MHNRFSSHSIDNSIELLQFAGAEVIEKHIALSKSK